MSNFKVERLAKGESFITCEHGNSMAPRINSGQKHKLEPAKWTDVNVGDIVYCKVYKNYYTHLVLAIDAHRGCQIGNNHGNVNGWTKNIYGKVTQVIV